ncbi:Growth-regulating factor 3, partial [Mucuna pruriens]
MEGCTIFDKKIEVILYESNNEYASRETVKQEGQSLLSFFDEWPKSKESWSSLENERSNQTQLSISISKSSSNFSTTSS